MKFSNKFLSKFMYSKRIKPIFTVFLLILLTGIIPAQKKGSISGKIIDKSNNEILIGANVIIQGTMTGASTDLDGMYKISNLSSGTYSLKFSYISYQPMIVSDVVVTEGKNTVIDVSLLPVTTELEAVTITAEALKSNEAAVLNIQKNSNNIVDGLSAELISKNNSSDGTDILSRMTGVTISEGKYAYVRGVGDRYNNTLLNGASLPSTDPEKKSFSYDIFPASLIENVFTSKTFTPDKPADFSGGLVEISTIEFPGSFIFDISSTANYDTKTTLKDFTTYNGGSKDWLGYDDGTRAMPSDITAEKVGRGNYTTDELKSIGTSFANDWQTHNTKAPMNGSFKINLGNSYNFSDDQVFGFIASVNYSNSNSARQIERNNYTFEGPRYLFNGANYSKSVSLNGLLNVSYKFAQNHKISIKNIFNRNADDETNYYEGDYFYNPDYRKVTSMRYVSRSLFSTQVIGEHHFSLFNSTQLDWNFNFAEAKRDEPDTRRYVYIKSSADADEPFRFALDQSQATRFYGNLNDKNLGAGADISMTLFDNPMMPKIKFGFHNDKKDRTFDARTFGFRNIPGGDFMREDSVLQQSVDKIFTPENFENRFIEVVEITKPSDSYKSNQNVTAGFFMTDFEVLSHLKVITGFRFERSKQELSSLSQTGEEVKIDPTYNDWLPSLNMSYGLTPQMNIRFGYSKTLARPEFRELAPFSYYDFLSAELVQGNTELRRSKIDNYDFRWEFYPEGKELFAVGFFYKKFVDPIEQILIAGSGFEPIRSFANAKSATNYGLEFELRKNMNFAGQVFNNFSFVGNLSLIKSKIKLAESGFQVSERPLQGQADFILNLGLYYDDLANGFNSSLIYNKVGEKISKVGFANLGDIVELPRDQIDFSVGKKFFESLSFKAVLKDILAQDHKFIQRTTDGDKIAELWKSGRRFSFEVGYSF